MVPTKAYRSIITACKETMRLPKLHAAALACLLLLCAQAVQAANKVPKGKKEGVGNVLLQRVPSVV